MILVNQAMSSICTGCGSSDRPAGVLAQRPAQERHVEAVDVQGHVGQGVVGNQVEGDVGIAQGEVEIDQGDVVVGVLGEIAAEVDGEAGAADAAAGADHGDHRGVDLEAAVAVRCCRRPRCGFARRRCRAPQQLFEHHRLREEFLGPGRGGPARIDWPSPRALTARIGMPGNSAVSC